MTSRKEIMGIKRKETILVVDDVPDNIAVLSGILRSDFRVICATGGEDALEVVQQQPVDLILLDVMMPDMDGYEVCRRLKADITTREIPVIFVTALSAPLDEAYGLGLGAVDYLHKPCHDSIVHLRVLMHLERRNNSLALERLVRERTADLNQLHLDIVQRLGRAAEFRDNETGMHVIRMSEMARLLALEAGVPETQANILLNAAPMHDIGKIGIPDAVLLKPGKLDAAEWEIMKTHPFIGAEIIGDHASEMLKMARSVALTHHEKWDGSGYPQGLSGLRIPMESRIVAITDVFDALTNERPYKRPWSVEETLEEMARQSNRHFDPRLLQIFMKILPDIEKIRCQYADSNDHFCQTNT